MTQKPVFNFFRHIFLIFQNILVCKEKMSICKGISCCENVSVWIKVCVQMFIDCHHFLCSFLPIIIIYARMNMIVYLWMFASLLLLSMLQLRLKPKILIILRWITIIFWEGSLNNLNVYMPLLRNWNNQYCISHLGCNRD